MCAAEGGLMGESHAHSVNSAECTTSRDQQFESLTAARTRTRTVGQYELQRQIPRIVRTACSCALNSLRHSHAGVFT